MLSHKKINSTNRYVHLVVGKTGDDASVAHDVIEAVVNKPK